MVVFSFGEVVFDGRWAGEEVESMEGFLIFSSKIEENGVVSGFGEVVVFLVILFYF